MHVCVSGETSPEWPKVEKRDGGMLTEKERIKSHGNKERGFREYGKRGVSERESEREVKGGKEEKVV